MRKSWAVVSVMAIFLVLFAAPARVRAEGADAAQKGQAWQTLEIGADCHEVFALKLLLRYNGYDPGDISTVFGDETAAALAAFQRKAGFEADGRLKAEDVYEALTYLAPIIAGDEPTPPLGAETDAIDALRYLLINKHGFTGLDADGAYDAAARAAVVLFRLNHGISTNGENGADGTVGHDTWARLLTDKRITGQYQYSWAICADLPKDRGTTGVLRLFNKTGKLLLEAACLGQSLTMNEDWREKFANTPLGVFRAKISGKSRKSDEFGEFACVDFNDGDVRAATLGNRDNILIHSGQSAHKDKPDGKLPEKYKNCRAKTIGGLDQTHGCLRVSADTHAKIYWALVNLGKGAVIVWEVD